MTETAKLFGHMVSEYLDKQFPSNETNCQVIKSQWVQFILVNFIKQCISLVLNKTFLLSYFVCAIAIHRKKSKNYQTTK